MKRSLKLGGRSLPFSLSQGGFLLSPFSPSLSSMSLILLSLSDPVRLTRLELSTAVSALAPWGVLLFLCAACFSLARATFSTSCPSLACKEESEWED